MRGKAYFIFVYPTLLSDFDFKIPSFLEFIANSSHPDSTMTTRTQGVAALTRNRETVKECLQQNIESAQNVVENPKDGDSCRTWPLRQAKSNLAYAKGSY